MSARNRADGAAVTDHADQPAGTRAKPDALQTEKIKLASTLTETQRTAQELAQRVDAATQEATMSKERLAQLQRDLEQRQAESERQKQQLAQLEQSQAEARQKIENLNVAVKVAEQEKLLLKENAESLKTQVESERQERQQVQRPRCNSRRAWANSPSNPPSSPPRSVKPPDQREHIVQRIPREPSSDTFTASRASLFGPGTH